MGCTGTTSPLPLLYLRVLTTFFVTSNVYKILKTKLFTFCTKEEE
jgi:hypothetical protein